MRDRQPGIIRQNPTVKVIATPFLTAMTVLATACGPAEVRTGPKPPPAAAEWAEADPADHEFTVRAVPGGLEVLEEGEAVSRVAVARPVVEKMMFVKEGRQLIVRSRGVEGPAVLELFDSTISFHAQYQQSRTPQALMDLLVTNSDNPCSLGWVAHTLRARLLRMGQLADGATLSLAELVPQLVEMTPESLWPWENTGAQPGKTLPLHAALVQCQTAARDVSDQLCGLFFTHSGEARYSVGA